MGTGKALNAEQQKIQDINKPVQEGSKKYWEKAKKEKNDEFYTRMIDIESEMKHHKRQFKNKTILMNCDDPEWSNFWKYFTTNMSILKIKKLISTHYQKDGSPSYALSSTIEVVNGKEKVIQRKVKLKGDGDFRSEECIDLLKESDIVITNPPFSLFREFISKIIEYNKKFIVIGNVGSPAFKVIFDLIKEDKIWVGHTGRVNKFSGDIDGLTESHAPGCWFTNLGPKPIREEILLKKKYKDKKNIYPKYDNLDAIHVTKVADIPFDYPGIIGAPITLFVKINLEQFEIVGISENHSMGQVYIDGSKKSTRLLVRNRKVGVK